MKLAYKTAVPPVPNKPHIMRKNGWWRVSPWNGSKRVLGFIEIAHYFVIRLNSKLHDETNTAGR